MAFLRTIPIIALISTAQSAIAQTTYYVNDSCGNDAWSGTSSVCSAPNGPKLTIQAGIDASVTGDAVIVADGTYIGAGNKHLDFHGKLITVRSENGPANCIIDCENDGRGFTFHSGETEQAILEGLTIRNGAVSRKGGGVWCARGSPTLIDCTFAGNQAENGGGMYNEGGSSPTLIGCKFIANSAALGGGGMFNRADASPTLIDCQFSRNSAGRDGGGMHSTGRGGTSAPMLRNCTFRENFAENNGGGMYNRGGTSSGISIPTLTNCTFDGNTSGDSGGGLYNRGGTAGGRCTPTLVNCAVFGNTAGDSRGGGMYNAGGTSAGAVDVILTNCTISGNNGGGIRMWSGGGVAELAATSCIVWNNTDGQIQGTLENSAVTFSDVQGGFPGIGNISTDPLFRAPARGNYRISAGSPVIDAGDNSAVPPEITVDLYGNPRFVDDPSTPDCQQAPGQCGDPPVVDMGVFEFPGGSCDACDMNCDGDINEFDIEPFVDLLFDPSAQPCDTCSGDVNGDGSINALDIEGFINCLFP